MTSIPDIQTSKPGPASDDHAALTSAWYALVNSETYQATIGAEADRRLSKALQDCADPRINGEALAVARAEAGLWSEVRMWKQRWADAYQRMQQDRIRQDQASSHEEDLVGQRLEDQWYENRP